MDRTSWIGVLICLALLFTWGWWSTKEAAKLAAQREVEKAKAAAVAKTEKDSPAAAEKGAAAAAGATTTVATAPAGAPKAETAVLENDHLRIHLTSEGAGIQRAEMKKHPRHIEGAGADGGVAGAEVIEARFDIIFGGLDVAAGVAEPELLMGGGTRRDAQHGVHMPGIRQCAGDGHMALDAFRMAGAGVMLLVNRIENERGHARR